MMRCLAVAFFCMVVGATSSSQTDAPKEAQKQSIQGKVVEAKSGQPVRKVNVEVVGGAGQSFGPHSATTIEEKRPSRFGRDDSDLRVRHPLTGNQERNGLPLHNQTRKGRAPGVFVIEVTKLTLQESKNAVRDQVSHQCIQCCKTFGMVCACWPRTPASRPSPSSHWRWASVPTARSSVGSTPRC